MGSSDHTSLRGRPEGVPAKDAWQYFSRYVGQALHLKRELDHISQQHVAKELSHLLQEDVTIESINQLEQDVAGLSWNTFAAWCMMLNCEPSDVMISAQRMSARENLLDKEIADGAQRDADELLPGIE